MHESSTLPDVTAAIRLPDTPQARPTRSLWDSSERAAAGTSPAESAEWTEFEIEDLLRFAQAMDNIVVQGLLAAGLDFLAALWLTGDSRAADMVQHALAEVKPPIGDSATGGGRG